MKSLLRKIFFPIAVTAVIALVATEQSAGQADSIRNPEQYLYTKFTMARIATRVGKDLTILGNYNIVTEVITFMQKGQIYDLVDYHNVDTIYFKDHIFIPGEKAFYELKESGPVSLLIRHVGTIQGPPKPAAYGGTSEVSSSKNLNYLQMSGNIYRLKNETKLIIKETDEYLIGKGEKVNPFKNKKQFLSIFPEIKSELRSYIQDSTIHFDQEEDLVKIVSYCNSILK